MLTRMLVVSMALAAQPDPSQLVSKARDATARNRSEEAKALLASAIKIYESGGAARADEHAEALFELDELTPRATSLLDKALSLRTSLRVSAEAHIRRGIRHVADKEYDKAEQFFREAAKRDAGQASRVSIWLAITFERSSRHDQVPGAIEDAMRTSPAPSVTAGMAATIYTLMGRSEDAEAMRKRGSEGTRGKAPVVPSEAGVYRVGGGVSAPAIIERFEPRYTEEARVAKHVGAVVLFLVVDESGVPTQLQVLRGLGMGLDESAIGAVKTWRFRPGTKDGAAVKVRATVEVNFRLL